MILKYCIVIGNELACKIPTESIQWNWLKNIWENLTNRFWPLGSLKLGATLRIHECSIAMDNKLAYKTCFNSIITDERRFCPSKGTQPEKLYKYFYFPLSF